MSKGALEISFAWLFAIIVGAFIIFLAIFLVTRMINVEQETVGAKTGEEIGVLLNPLETGFESGSSTMFSIPAETRINNSCDEEGSFGSQGIQIAQKSFGKWKQTNLESVFYNKYIFSNEVIEGKNFYAFSKPFEFPFKVADLVYMSSVDEEYCFLDPPAEIEEEISNLNQENLKLKPNCSEESVKVCFSGKCDIFVDYNTDGTSGHVKKNNEDLYFETHALMYAGVFSAPDIYECQVERLMKRLKELALIYKEKEESFLELGCDDDMSSDLSGLANNAEDVDSLSSLGGIVYDLENKNKFADCRLW